MPTASPTLCRSTWSRPAGRRPSTIIFGRVTKARILEAVREAKGERAAQLIEQLKKGDMAREGRAAARGFGLAARAAAHAGPRTASGRETGDCDRRHRSRRSKKRRRTKAKRPSTKSSTRAMLKTRRRTNPTTSPPNRPTRAAATEDPPATAGPFRSWRTCHVGAQLGTGAPSRARGRGGVPPLSLQRSPRGPLLAGRRCSQHARPQPVRPLEGPKSARARPANGPTPPPANMAIFSTLSARAAASTIFATCR